ncbi:hypothetical protein LCM02_09210 [Lutimonas saemankumensis]|uniref:hypothetical protein n=1 Tax=Lutimonas saemankumensis TaxID=483016 RepID=UPI001CD2E8A2|nr:hypothetical protein [Lutimonas saemankumensis]MCA0932628.1 hypothetical protein [Lutimonas saemankumensis]
MGKSFKDMSFLQTFLVIAAIFLVIVVLIEFLYGLTRVSFEEALAGLMNPKYLLRKLAGSVIYALIMTFYFKRKRKKTA